jgi:hypothetical protein
VNNKPTAEQQNRAQGAERKAANRLSASDVGYA